ncbi:unnamed protein product [Polarella glacialis]|uniref:EF-hand domain-containing protein n=1 Tax=Polarella glacialis TaxID=89957 RepID=A0A813J970_POLGL|nr:unnamed protein product [Polarella glacialis]CAE8688881.1 unnamed protein product [Polarella glacialis]
MRFTQMWIYRSLFFSLAAKLCSSEVFGYNLKVIYRGRFELIEKSVARNFPFIDKDGSGCVSVLEAQEVIFGKWLLGWNITDLSHLVAVSVSIYFIVVGFAVICFCSCVKLS